MFSHNFNCLILLICTQMNMNQFFQMRLDSNSPCLDRSLTSILIYERKYANYNELNLYYS